MKSISLLASLAAVSALCLSASCSSKSDSNNGSAGTSSGGTSAGSSSGGSSGNSSSNGGSSGNSSSNGGSANGGSANGGSGNSTGNAGADNAGASNGGAGTIGACGNGIVIEGDPTYMGDAMEPKTAGQGALTDPPINPAEEIAVIGDKLFINSEEEIWMADLTGASPQIKRIAGLRGSKTFVAGACADARFLVVHGITATADGKLAMVDYIGNAVVEITDPSTAACAVHYVAGTHASTPDPGGDAGVANPGDKDGAGNVALFGGDPQVTSITGGGIHKITADPAGNYYTWDDGTGKVKKIANDANRTVSTIGLLSTDDEVTALTFLNGKLYAIANHVGNDTPLFQIDPTTYSAADMTKPSKNIKTLFRLDSESSGTVFPELDGQGQPPLLTDLENDGTNLIAASALSFIWKIGTDGSYVSTLAGTLNQRGEPGFIDYESGFDPTIAHPANMWQLVVTSGAAPDAAPWIALDNGSLYWSGGAGTGEFVIKFGCP